MSNNWKQQKLGEIVTFQRGFDITKKEQKVGQIPVISSSGINSYHNEYKVKGPGLVIGRKGSLGTVHYVESDYWPHDTTLWVKDFHENNPRFCYYFLHSLNLEQYDTGSSNPTLNRNHIHLINVTIPDRKIQDRIASILGAIDDLVEVNLRRIEVLEEVAWRIYKEWFIYLRYPGHENTETTQTPNGLLPDGWKTQSFADIADFINGFAFKPKDWKSKGKPIIKIAELKNGITKKTPFYEKELPDKYHIQNGDILFSWSANLNVYEWRKGDSWLNQHIFKVVPKKGFTKLFLYYSLKNRMQQFRNISQGTTMKHIKRNALKQVYLIIPPFDFIFKIDRLLEPIHNQLMILETQNLLFLQIRDLLLPKLISGEIDISDMAIQL